MIGYTVWLKAKVKEKYKELHYRKATSRRLDQVTEDDPYCIPRTATFQRFVNSLLNGMADRVETHIDDIAVYSQT